MQAALEMQRRDAMRLGYRDGVAAALGDVVAHLLRTEQAQRRWRGDLLAQVRELLSATSRHADTMLAVLDEVLDDLLETAADAAPDAPLTLVLPLRLKVRADAIRQRVQAVCEAPLKLEYRTAANGSPCIGRVRSSNTTRTISWRMPRRRSLSIRARRAATCMHCSRRRWRRCTSA